MKIGILGASSNLGFSFINLMEEEKLNIYLLKHKSNLSYFAKCKIIEDKKKFFKTLNIIYSFIPIWEFYELLESNKSNLRCSRIIVMSSTSASTKFNSKDKWESDYARKFINAEKDISKICNDLDIKLLILRPTMIWGRKSDLNISFLMKFIVNYGFLILPSHGNGKRYPIHVNQLARSVKDLSDKADHGLFNILGPTETTYLKMCQEIFLWYGFNPLIFKVPAFSYALIIYFSKNIFKKKYINRESFMRIDKSPNMGYSNPRVYIAKGSFNPELDDLYSPTFFAQAIQFLVKFLNNSKQK